MKNMKDFIHQKSDKVNSGQDINKLLFFGLVPK